MDRFDETPLPDKETFYSGLNVEHFIDKVNTNTQKVFEESKIKDLGEYHDLYVQSDTLLLANVFQNFRNKCI